MKLFSKTMLAVTCFAVVKLVFASQVQAVEAEKKTTLNDSEKKPPVKAEKTKALFNNIMLNISPTTHSDKNDGEAEMSFVK